MKPMPHNTSPLELLNHRFLEFECKATIGDQTGGSLGLKTQYEIAADADNPLRWQVTLAVEFSPDALACPSTYQGKIKIIGEFQIHDSYAEKNRDALIRVTAVSILYGACREMVANFTARSVHGILSLPSISFWMPKQEPQTGNE
jgi:preprotein translocase subunit SecB